MLKNTDYEVIIVGGSYSGLSAAMTLGRSLRKVLILDSGKPCNRQTPHSHNFITQDGEKPSVIFQKAKDQVLNYPTVAFRNVKATKARKQEDTFYVETEDGKTVSSQALLFATGVTDIMPEMKGFAECWGISILHCPYCHGYEVHGKDIGIIANGDLGFEYSKLIYNWTKDLTLFTNGVSTLSEEHSQKLKKYSIQVVEKEIDSFEHKNGMLSAILFKDGSRHSLTAVFTRPAFKQHCEIPQSLGCAMTENGLVQVDEMQKTNVKGVYAAGDATILFRTVSLAVSSGTKAGAMMNKELIDSGF